MHSLPLFLRLTGRPAILIGTGEAADAKRRLLERAGALVVDEDSPAAIAIIACDDGEEKEAATVRLRARGVLLNVVDRPDLCDFTMPAIVDRDPVIIAVGTGGASAGLAKAVRQRIERLLPPQLGALAQALDAAKGAIRGRWPDARDRRGALDAGLAQGGALDPVAVRDGAEAVTRWLAAADDQPPARTVGLTLSSPDPDELTLRAARLLGEADVVLYGPGVPPLILDRARADAVRRPLPPGEPAEDRRGLTIVLTLAP
ncbi:siroheme synthase [Sphingobium sufflavum]|uniref:precorrin-2 dehydrogenase/sirohydrochlorin ferrochelatase family protein n=1 Tax=Sphingobium sufflavum TaxID=1129547 RepID=UPI001F329CE3|nr:bifunctional precorrin-2 dehydrogenase/sirohydrochlorin ferrochelatase [Sphingobium sufflavum]MCE7795238.1 siroheme synthase [Sphingobium sufflavum]